MPGALFAEVLTTWSSGFPKPQRQRSRVLVEAEHGHVQNEEAPEGRAPSFKSSGSGFMKKRGGQGGGDCLEPWDFGLAEEIARVEQAARDWGVHVDAVGRSVLWVRF